MKMFGLKFCLCVGLCLAGGVLSAQTDRELLLEIVKQQAKLSEQQLATNAEVKGIGGEIKGIQKQADILL